MDLETEGAIEGTETESEQPEGLAPSKSFAEALDLPELKDGQRFRYGGKEWDPKELTSGHLRQKDYTQKTQQIAEERKALETERKYQTNLRADLETVRKNPQLAEEFRKTYPEGFHGYLDLVLQSSAQPQVQGQAQQQASQTPAVDPAFLDRVNRLEADLHERNVAAIDAELDAKFKTLTEKYPMADEEAVLARAQSLLEKGEIDLKSTNGRIPDKVWDGIWKQVHDRFQKLSDQAYSKRIKQQQTTNLKGKDAASGGGIPGQAPKTPRTIKEATAMYLQDQDS